MKAIILLFVMTGILQSESSFGKGTHVTGNTLNEHDMKSHITKHDTISPISVNETFVCKLSNEALQTRKKELLINIFSKVSQTTELSNGFQFNFPYSPNFLNQLTDWIIAENECCPFLTFNLKIRSNENLVLSITGEPQVKELIRSSILGQD